MSLSTIGSIAIHLAESIDLPTGISGNLIEIVDMARQNVANYTGETIGSNSIDEEFQPVILDFAKADAIDFSVGAGDMGNVKLAELSVDGKELMSADAYRKMGESKLKLIGKKVNFTKSLS